MAWQHKMQLQHVLLRLVTPYLPTQLPQRNRHAEGAAADLLVQLVPDSLQIPCPGYAGQGGVKGAVLACTWTASLTQLP